MFQRICKISRMCSNRTLSQTVTTQSNKNAARTESENSTEKWDICAGVLVERLPVVSKSLKPIEKEFQSLLWQMEFEKSLKSDHEIKNERDLLHAELIRKGEMEVDLDDSSSKQTAQDLKDAYVEEHKNFKLSERITEADRTNDLQSTSQKLEDILYLVVEQKFGEKKQMALPQGTRIDGETMRQTAERVLKEKCGENINVSFYGNAPCGFYKYKYPSSQRNDTVGAKIFFYRTSLKGGNVDQKLAKNFEWRNKDTLGDKLNATYTENIKKFLF